MLPIDLQSLWQCFRIGRLVVMISHGSELQIPVTSLRRHVYKEWETYARMEPSVVFLNTHYFQIHYSGVAVSAWIIATLEQLKTCQCK